MWQNIVIPEPETLELETLPEMPDEIHLVCSDTGTVLVSEGDTVCMGQPILRFDNHVDHSSVSGRVVSINGRITIKRLDTDHRSPLTDYPAQTNYPEFLKEIGLLGMGGGRFPAGIKLKASKGAATLVINGVECEPHVTIDHSLLLNESEQIKAGVNASAEAVGAETVVLAVQGDAAFIQQLAEIYDYKILTMGNTYPSGSERLIIKKLIGSMPPAGILPFHLGILVQNTASLWAVGCSVKFGLPVLQRPLTLHAPGTGVHKNVIAPIGMTVRDLLKIYNCEPTEGEQIIHGGMMMGTLAGSDELIYKGTTSILVLPTKSFRREERSCINCGSCYNVCPLGLHPKDMAERVRENRSSAMLDVHVSECLLCGLCSSVCPSNIPLSNIFAEGRKKK